MSLLKKIYNIFYFPAKINRKKHTADVKKRIINDDFSILCCNCMAGIIYHELGMKFLSPTINTMIPSNDFVKFISNIKHYLNQELEFIHKPVYLNDKLVQCPVAKLDDIMIYFTHYETEKESKEKWDDRKNRINWDNVYVIFNDRDGVTKDSIEHLNFEPFKNVVMFTSKDDFEFSFSVKMKDEDIENINFINRLSGLRVFEEKFDYVSFLNSEKVPAKTFKLK